MNPGIPPRLYLPAWPRNPLVAFEVGGLEREFTIPPDPVKGSAEVLRVLKPGGCFVLAIRPPEAVRRLSFTRHGFRLYEPPQLEEMLGDAGFTRVRCETHDDGDGRGGKAARTRLFGLTER